MLHVSVQGCTKCAPDDPESLVRFFPSSIFFLVVAHGVLSGKLTCPLKINGWKMYFLFEIVTVPF